MTQTTKPTNPFAAAIARRHAAELARRNPAAAARAEGATPADAAAEAQPQTAPAQAAAEAVAADPAPVAAPATPQPEAATPVVAATEESKSIQIITSTGDLRFDAIVVGTVGSLDERGCFQIDPDYQRVSYLFTLAAGSMLPAVQPGQEMETTTDGEIVAKQGERTIELTMPAAAAAALKVNLISMCAARWDGFYEQQSRGLTAGSVNANMLNAERALVGGNVDRYIAEKALKVWDVPVIYSVTVTEEDPALRAQDEGGLLKAAGHRFTRLMPDVTRLPTLRAAAEEDTGAAEAEAITPLPAEWCQHTGGLELTVEGTMPVFAASAADAAKLTTALLMAASAAPSLQASLKPTADSIQTAVLLAPTPPDDDDGDGYDRYR